MNMNININAFGMDNRIMASEQKTEQADTKDTRQSVFMGNTTLANDPIAQRRKEAQQAAWSVVRNAWDSDKAVDEMVESRRNHYAELSALKKEAVDELSGLADDKEVLRELYETPLDSEEQKDLELLEKAMDINAGVSDAELTEEERKRLGELYQGERTEYQQRVLELHKRETQLKCQIADADKQMRDDTSDIHEISKERLKENPMLDAKKEAEDIMDAANKEIIGIAAQEAKEHMDEKLEEEAEKAEKNAKEKEAREEQLAEQKLNRAVQEAMLEGTKEAAEKAKAAERRADMTEVDTAKMIDIAKSSGASGNVTQELEEIKNNMKLLEADLKGIKVDQEI